MSADLNEVAFEERIIEFIGSASAEWLIDCVGPDGMHPVGIVLGHILPDQRRIEAHIDWFPWATPRNKFEGIAAFLRYTSKKYKILVYVESDETAFWDRLVKYRLLCQGCKIRNHFHHGGDAMFYYTLGP